LKEVVKNKKPVYANDAEWSKDAAEETEISGLPFSEYANHLSIRGAVSDIVVDGD